MKAMILAAGLGTRMRPLTDKLPKPLLPVAGKSLIEWQIERLKNAGVTELVINIAYLGELIQRQLGDGSRLGVSIQYSVEEQPLETAGAINRALPLLGDEPFLLVNGDVWCDMDLRDLCARKLGEDQLGHLLLVPNPEFKTHGDFDVDARAALCLCDGASEGFTFAGVSLLRPQLIAGYPARREVFALREVFDWAIERGALSGEIYRGLWMDIGTPERLAELQAHLI